MQKNPFDISFGKKPYETISRIVQSREILETFLTEPVTHQIFMITGVRGSGKTVLMNMTANEIENEPDWFVVRLNPDRDILHSLGAKLCSINECAALFRQAKLNLSVFGLGIELDRSQTGMDAEAAIEQMLRSLKKHGKKLLITVDEVTNNEYMKAFAGSFQIFVGQELPVFLLMTGLYENIEELQNEENLTFLYRAPKIKLPPLNLNQIAARYEAVFSLPHDRAAALAELTKGYSFAFQALGFVMWNKGTSDTDFMLEYRQILEEYVYEKIWSELSNKDKLILYGLALSSSGKISEVNALLGLKTDEINQYRKRLIRKGIVDAESRGYLQFTLPLFEQFVIDQGRYDKEMKEVIHHEK